MQATILPRSHLRNAFMHSKL